MIGRPPPASEKDEEENEEEDEEEDESSTPAGPMGASSGALSIVAAWAPELRGLGRVFHQGRSPKSRAGAATLRVEGAPPIRAVVGVGLVEAAAGTARVIERQHPRAIVLVGTAGLYPVMPSRPGKRTPESKAAAKTAGSTSTAAGARVSSTADTAAALQVGGAVIVRRIHLASDSVAREEAYLPEPLPLVAEASAELVQALAAATGLPIVDVACPLAITRTAALARTLAGATGAALENLEAFAVARAAAAANVPFAAVLGIANDVGPAAHAQWRANAERAAAAACAAVRTWLGQITS